MLKICCRRCCEPFTSNQHISGSGKGSSSHLIPPRIFLKVNHRLDLLPLLRQRKALEWQSRATLIRSACKVQSSWRCSNAFSSISSAILSWTWQIITLKSSSNGKNNWQTETTINIDNRFSFNTQLIHRFILHADPRKCRTVSVWALIVRRTSITEKA